MFEKSISFILAMVMTVSLGTSRFTSTDTNQDVLITVDNAETRVAVSDDATAIYGKETNTMYITEGDLSYSFSLEQPSN